MLRDQNRNVINDTTSWYQINGLSISNLNLTLILADLIFKQIEAICLAELIISAIYDQLMKLNFLSLIFLRPINSCVTSQKQFDWL